MRREPRWRYPVGDGANRVRAGVVGSLDFCASFVSVLSPMDSVLFELIEDLFLQDRHIQGRACVVRNREGRMVTGRSTRGVIIHVAYAGGIS